MRVRCQKPATSLTKLRVTVSKFDDEGRAAMEEQRRNRAGVILVHRLPGDSRLWFGFGVDTESGDLTDFGGGVRAHETVTESALREFTEETLGALGYCLRPDGHESGHVCAYSSSMAILFLRCADTETRESISARFALAHTRRLEAIDRREPRPSGSRPQGCPPSPEVSSIVWLTEAEIRPLLDRSSKGFGDRPIFSRVRKFLEASIDDIVALLRRTK